MTLIMQSVHDRLVQEAADNYTRQGYYVLVSPSENDLPDFLKGFQPDMLVRLPNGDQVIVQVKSNRASRNGEQWQKLRDAVETHSGWRLRTRT